MTHTDDIVKLFSERVNAALAAGTGATPAEVAEQAPLEETADQELVGALRHAAQLAQEPEHFYNERVLEPDERFYQCYGLLCATFDEAERDPLDRFLFMLRMLQNPANDHPLVMLGRFWRVPGSQEYDEGGQLRRFAYDPLSVTESIMSLVSGNYMSLRPARANATGIGAIGHLATRERFRGGHGHGSVLLRAYESKIEEIAQERAETLALIALEAQSESEGFWYKQGYQWAVGTDYAQPPLDFDQVTGERLHDEVPETLMVKLPGQPGATVVDAHLLADAVGIMYQNWNLEKTQKYGAAAAHRAEEYVMGKVFASFLASLPQDGNVPLGPPPSLRR